MMEGVTRLNERVTSTPNNDEINAISNRRTVRSRPVSYAEFPDFDTSGSDMSFNNESANKKHPVKRFVLSSSRRSSVSPAFAETSETSIGGTKKLIVKNLNDSQEIQDIDRVVPKISASAEPSPIVTPEKSAANLSQLNMSISSPGKYNSVFAVTQRIETPTGQIKLRLNRRTKPQQSTPIPNQTTEKPLRTSLIIPRLNRSACKEMGLSPNKLVSILTSQTPPKPKKSSSISIVTPEKENKPESLDTCSKLRKENDINKTPRIRIKKVPSGLGADSVNWQAEQILSPQKTVSPLKRLPTLGESPVNSYSPLSSVSLHKLTTSPIINTQIESEKKRRGRPKKQLAYI